MQKKRLMLVGILVITILLITGGLAAAQDFSVDQLLVKLLMKENSELTKDISIHNKITEPQLLQFSSNIPMLTLEQEAITIDGYQKLDIPLHFNTRIPDLYAGKLTVQSGEDIQNIPIILEVESKDLLVDSTLNILAQNRVIKAGQDTTVEVRVYSLADSEPLSVDLEYMIIDLDGNVIFTETENIVVKVQTSFYKTLKLPEYLEPGQYVFAVKTTYKGASGFSSYLFDIEGKGFKTSSSDIWEFLKNNIFNLLIVLVLIIVLFELLRPPRDIRDIEKVRKDKLNKIKKQEGLKVKVIEVQEKKKASAARVWLYKFKKQHRKNLAEKKKESKIQAIKKKKEIAEEESLCKVRAQQQRREVKRKIEEKKLELERQRAQERRDVEKKQQELRKKIREQEAERRIEKEFEALQKSRKEAIKHLHSLGKTRFEQLIKKRSLLRKLKKLEARIEILSQQSIKDRYRKKITRVQINEQIEGKKEKEIIQEINERYDQKLIQLKGEQGSVRQRLERRINNINKEFEKTIEELRQKIKESEERKKQRIQKLEQNYQKYLEKLKEETKKEQEKAKQTYKNALTKYKKEENQREQTLKQVYQKSQERIKATEEKLNEELKRKYLSLMKKHRQQEEKRKQKLGIRKLLGFKKLDVEKQHKINAIEHKKQIAKIKGKQRRKKIRQEFYGKVRHTLRTAGYIVGLKTKTEKQAIKRLDRREDKLDVMYKQKRQRLIQQIVQQGRQLQELKKQHLASEKQILQSKNKIAELIKSKEEKSQNVLARKQKELAQLQEKHKLRVQQLSRKQEKIDQLMQKKSEMKKEQMEQKVLRVKHRKTKSEKELLEIRKQTGDKIQQATQTQRQKIEELQKHEEVLKRKRQKALETFRTKMQQRNQKSQVHLDKLHQELTLANQGGQTQKKSSLIQELTKSLEDYKQLQKQYNKEEIRLDKQIAEAGSMYMSNLINKSLMKLKLKTLTKEQLKEKMLELEQNIQRDNKRRDQLIDKIEAKAKKIENLRKQLKQM